MSAEVRTDAKGMREVTITDENGDRLWIGERFGGEYQGRAHQEHRPQNDGGAAAYISTEDLTALRNFLNILLDDDEVFIVVPHIQDWNDSRYRTHRHEEAVEIGYFVTKAQAQAYVDVKVNAFLAAERERFDAEERERQLAYQRRVRNRTKTMQEHEVLLAAGLHGPDQEPKPVGVFVPKVFDEEAAKKRMEPRYDIEEIRKALLP